MSQSHLLGSSKSIGSSVSEWTDRGGVVFRYVDMQLELTENEVEEFTVVIVRVKSVVYCGLQETNSNREEYFASH